MMEDNLDNARFAGKAIGLLHHALKKINLPLKEENLLDTVRSWALPETQRILHLDRAFCDCFLCDFAECYPSLPRQIIHRDPNPGNMIQEKESWGFIDFDLSQRNVRIFDPVYAASAVLSETFSDWSEEKGKRWLRMYQNILRGYDAVNPLTEMEKKSSSAGTSGEPDDLRRLVCLSGQIPGSI